jgi:hypothetical protein
MNLVELDRALRQLRLPGMAAVIETRLRQAQAEKLRPIDLVDDDLRHRQGRFLDRRHKLARFRDPDRSPDTFDFDFTKKMNRALVCDRREPPRADHAPLRARVDAADVKPVRGRLLSVSRRGAFRVRARLRN